MTEMSGAAAGGLPPVPVLQPDAALTLAAVAPPERGLVDPPPAVAGTDSRHEQLYPILTEAQLAELRPLGDERSFRAGEVLWHIGERDICVFVVLSGRVEVVRRGPLGDEAVIATHLPGGYSGEVSTLAGRPALVEGRAATDTTVVAIGRQALRELVITRADLSEIVMRSFILRRMRMIANHVGGVTLIGSRYCADTLHLVEFLTRNGHPHTFLDLERATDVADLLERFHVRADEVPVVLCDDGTILRSPSLRELAERLGLAPRLEAAKVYDVAVVGAGPAGLAAAVYAASEGLSVLVIEPTAPGGQAGTSSKIENYLGFPTGVSGQALAGRAFTQAQKFGADIAVPRRLERFACGRPYHELELDGGELVHARAVVLASGARYRKPPLPDLERFEGAGVYYAATHLEGRLCREQDVVVVGGGNSAGQAAVFLSGHARRVFVLVRAPDLGATMSRYLIRRIEGTPNIELRTRTQVVALEGGQHLERMRWRDDRSGAEEVREARHLFLFIGAQPNADWADGRLARDRGGFLKTGPDLAAEDLAQAGWPLERRPFLLETSCPGVFAAGDVRSGSVKRVASAVGEGSVCVQYLHHVLGGH